MNKTDLHNIIDLLYGLNYPSYPTYSRDYFACKVIIETIEKYKARIEKEYNRYTKLHGGKNDKN